MAQGKKILQTFALMLNADASVSQTTREFCTEPFDRCTVEIFFVGTMSGTVTVQASTTFIPTTKYVLTPSAPVVWDDIPLGLVAVPGSNQNYIIDFTETGLPWLRVNYTAVGGAGTMTVVVTGKES